MPPRSSSIRLYCACPSTSPDVSLVTRLCTNCWLASPTTRNLPMCDTSKSPATLRTARCSSRIDVYCCGISQPPKSTMRPPRATCRSYSGVRFVVWLLAVDGVVDFELVGVDEREELLVVPASRVGHDLGDVTCPLDRPLELLRDLRLRRRPLQ